MFTEFVAMLLTLLNLHLNHSYIKSSLPFKVVEETTVSNGLYPKMINIVFQFCFHLKVK